MLLGLTSVFSWALFWAHQNDQLSGMSRSNWDSEYDYIVVGAGTAGAVLAARLSEDPNVKVLLLEAGGTENIQSEVPALASSLQRTEQDWQYETVAQESSGYAFKGQRIYWPRGKALGGSSTINYMLHVRGNRRDYDKWAAGGAQGWSYREVLPYFLKAEDMRNASLASNGFHSTGGPLTVSTLKPADVSPLSKAFIDASSHLGYEIGDYNGDKQAVFSQVQATIRDGRRCSTSKAYLRPASTRPNLHVVTFAYATKILFSFNKSNEPEVRGVRFEHYGSIFEVLARREVIVSGGTINSAQLLMLSGVGPGDQLEQHGIPVVVDLPVGSNLHDHISPSVLFSVKSKTSSPASRVLTEENALRYLISRDGPMTSSVGVDALSFIKSKYANQSDDWPDVQVLLQPTSIINDPSDHAKRVRLIRDDFYNQVFGQYKSLDTITLYPVILRPQSRGTIRLASADPFDEPLIDPRYLEDPIDVDMMVDAIKIAVAISGTPPMQAYEAKLIATSYPGCDKFELYSDEHLACMARTFPTPFYHPVGTCRMGHLDDPRTVVDPRLRVKGVRGLRVADASIMPTIVSGNIMAATVMIGEKAADMIRDDASGSGHLETTAHMDRGEAHVNSGSKQTDTQPIG